MATLAACTHEDSFESLPGWAEPVERRPWVEDAVAEEMTLKDGLRGLGLRATQYRGDVAARRRIFDEEMLSASQVTRMVRSRTQYYDSEGFDAAGAKFMAAGRRRAAERFIDWLQRRQYVTEASDERILWTPLFVLAPPDVSGCEARFLHQSEAHSERQWEVTIFGSGTGDTQVFAVGAKDEFVTSSPVRKLVFAPIPITVEAISVIRNGRVESRGLRVEPGSASISSLGVRTLADGEFDAADGGQPIETFWLGGDSTEDPSSFERSVAFEKTYTVSLGLEFSKLLGTVKTSIRTAHTIAVNLKLIGGHNYIQLVPKDVPGLHWTRE